MQTIHIHLQERTIEENRETSEDSGAASDSVQNAVLSCARTQDEMLKRFDRCHRIGELAGYRHETPVEQSLQQHLSSHRLRNEAQSDRDLPNDGHDRVACCPCALGESAINLYREAGVAERCAE